MKKKILTCLCAATMLMASTAVTAFASEPSEQNMPSNFIEITVESENGEKDVTVIDLNDMSKYVEHEDGTIDVLIQPRWSLSSHSISSGDKVWYTGSGSGMELERGQKVTFKASFDKSIKFECGYSGAGYTSAMKSGTARSFSTSTTMPADGTYKFYIENKSSSSVKVSSGSISY